MGTYNGFCASVQGHNHIKVNKICQDASDSWFEGHEAAIIAVADGHGSDNYPRTERGSAFAVKAAVNLTRELITQLEEHPEIDLAEDYEEILQQLAKSILKEWYVRVDQDMESKPFSEAELGHVNEKYHKRYLSGRYNAKAYGTTLIVVCLLKECWFGIQIGDGKCVVISNKGEISEPIPWDDACEQNITTSICDSNAIEEFRYVYSRELPAAVFIGTDGVDDSFPLASDYQELYRSIFLIAADHGISTAESEVKEYLPELTRRGSGDDISVACAIDQYYQADNVQLIRKYGDEYRIRQKYENAKAERENGEERIRYLDDAIKKNRAEYDQLKERVEKLKHNVEVSSRLENEAEKELAVIVSEIAELESAAGMNDGAESAMETEKAAEDAEDAETAEAPEATNAETITADEEPPAAIEAAEETEIPVVTETVDSADTWNVAEDMAAAAQEKPAEDVQ